MTQIADLRQQLLQMTPQEFDQLEQRVFGQPKEDLLLDRLAPNPATEPRQGMQFGDGDFLSTAASNIPHSLANRGRELETVVRHPLQTLAAMGNLAKGGLDVAAESLGADPTEEGQMARDFGNQFVDSFSAENVARDPTAPIANVAAAITPFAPKGSLLAKIGTVAGDPAGAAVMGAARPAMKIAGAATANATQGARSLAGQAGDFATQLAAEVPGFTTGRGGDRVRANVASGFDSPESATAARTQISDDLTSKDIGLATADVIQERIEELGRNKRSVLQQNEGQVVNIAATKQALLEQLQNNHYEIHPNPRAQSGFELIEPETILDADANRINKFVTRFLGSPDEITAKELDDFKLRVSKIKTTDPTAGAILSDIRRPIRTQLGEVPGYNEAVGELDELLTFVDDAESDLSGGRLRRQGLNDVNAVRVGNRLQRAFEEGGEDVMNVVASLDDRFPGLRLKSRLAAQGMSGIAPTNIVGRSQAAGIVGGLAAGGAGAATIASGLGVVPAVAAGIATLSFFSPKLVGRAAIELGATARQADELMKAVTLANNKARRSGILREVSTVGQLLERTGVMDEDPGLLGAIGATRR